MIVEHVNPLRSRARMCNAILVADPAIASTTGWPVGFGWREPTHPCHVLTGQGRAPRSTP